MNNRDTVPPPSSSATSSSSGSSTTSTATITTANNYNDSNSDNLPAQGGADQSNAAASRTVDRTAPSLGRSRSSSGRSLRPILGSAAPSDRVQAAHFTPLMTPLTTYDPPTSQSLASVSSLASLREGATSSRAFDSETDDAGSDLGNDDAEYDQDRPSQAQLSTDTVQHEADRIASTSNSPYQYRRPVVHSRMPTKLAEEEARDEVGELGGFSYSRVPRLFPSHSVTGGSSFAGSDVETQSQYDETRSVFSDVVSIFHPNEYLVAQQEQQAYENEISERGSILTANEADYESQLGDDGALGVPRSRRTSSSLLSVMSARPSLRTNYGAIGHGPASARFGSQINYPYQHLAPSLDRMDPDASAITMREALVSHSTKPGTNLGLVLIAISQVCYSTMNLFVKMLEEREGDAARRDQHSAQPALGALEIVGVECLIIWIGCVITMRVGRSEHILLGPPGTRMLLLARGMFGFASTLALYISLQTLSLSDATVITFLAPLATGLLANAVLDEPFTTREKVAGFLSLCGVVLIARPSFLFGTPSTDETLPPYDGDLPEGEPGMGGDDNESEGARLAGIAVALAGVFLMAGAWVCLRHIGKRASTYHSIAYFALCSWTCSFASMAVLRQPFVVPDSVQSLLLLTSVGVFSLLAQVFQTLGLQRETAARAATMSYLQIIFALFWQLTLFGTRLEWLSVVGSVLILTNGAWVALSKSANGEDGGVMAH